MGSSSSSRSGCPASARASEARVSSPPEKDSRPRSRSASVKPRPRRTLVSVVAPAVAARVLEPSLRLAVAAERLGSVVARGHRLLEAAELLLGGDEVGRARERVLPQRVAAQPGRALVVQRDTRALLPGQLSALQLHLADERPQQRRLPGAVRARRAPAGRAVSTLNETASKSGSPENSLRRLDAIRTAMLSRVMRVLAVDIGTSSARARVYDERAEFVAGRQERYTTTRGHSGRVGEFDADELIATTRDAMDVARVEAGGEVDAVSISCFWHSLVGVDGRGRAVTPVLTWRQVEHVRPRCRSTPTRSTRARAARCTRASGR